MADPTISSVISTAVDGISSQLWLIAPIGLAVFAIMWGVPVAKRFFKKLAS